MSPRLQATVSVELIVQQQRCQPYECKCPWVTDWMMKLHHWSAVLLFPHWPLLFRNELAQTVSISSLQFHLQDFATRFTNFSDPFSIFFPQKSTINKSSDFFEQILAIFHRRESLVLPCECKVRFSLCTHISLCISFNWPHSSWHIPEWASNSLFEWSFYK